MGGAGAGFFIALLRAWGLGPAAFWGWVTESWEGLAAGAGPAWPFLTGGGVAADVLSLLFEVLSFFSKSPSITVMLRGLFLSRVPHSKSFPVCDK